VGLALLTTAVAVFFFFLFFSPKWQITDIRILGNTTIPTSVLRARVEEVLEQPRFFFLSGRHRLFIQKQRVEEHLRAAFTFGDLRVDREGREVVVTVEELETTLLVVDEREELFYATRDGMVVRQATERERELFADRGSANPRVNGESVSGPFPDLQQMNRLPVVRYGEALGVSEQMAEPEHLRALLILYGLLEERGFAPTHAVLERSYIEWATVQLLDGPDILVNLVEDPAEQMRRLLLVLSYEITDFKGIDYIDVRFGNHIFYQ
jgi:hypothetical protein